jgi:hypothetical protein
MKLLIYMLSLASLAAAQRSMSYLDNGVIRIGVDLELGGAITYLAENHGENIINSADYGRQIQQSYYSGPQPYGQSHPAWKNWPWNPIGTGDVYGNKSRVVAQRNNGKTLYVRTVPLHWALNNVPCECTFETWIELEGNVAKVRAQINNRRIDRAQYKAFDQELPAVYTNGTFYRLFTYDGGEPFTGAPLRQMQNSGPPWTNWYSSENWAALVNDGGFGLGVFHPDVYTFIGGFHGKPGVGGPKDGSTGYISPVRHEILDHNIRYSYECRLIVGTLDQIREYAYAHRPESRPSYQFIRDRQHWTCINSTSGGFPLREHLRVALDQNDPQLIGPPGFWRAEDVPKLYVCGAWHTRQTQAQFFWSIPGQGFSASRSVGFAVRNDGEYHTYEVNLSGAQEWRGPITGLRFDPVPSGSKGEFIDLKYISFQKTPREAALRQ